MSEYQDPIKKPIGALWKKTSGKGTNYLFIKLELKDELGQPKPQLFRAYRNQFKKEGDNLPDFVIHSAEDTVGAKPKETPKSAPKANVPKAAARPVQSAVDPVGPVPDDNDTF